MTTVSITPAEITVSGHSGYAPPGQDIVCSAVSTLVCTLVQSFSALQNKKSYQKFEKKAMINKKF